MAVGFNIHNPVFINISVPIHDNEIVPAYTEAGYVIVSDQIGAVVLGEGLNQVNKVMRTVRFFFSGLNNLNAGIQDLNIQV